MTTKKSIRVHLVHGDRPVKLLLERGVDDDGPTAVSIHSGDHASDAFGQQEFDTEHDFEVPGFGRIETRHRQNPTQGADVVLLNGKASAEKAPVEMPVPNRRNASGYEFLTKPLSASDLDSILLEVKARSKKATGDEGSSSDRSTRSPGPGLSPRHVRRTPSGRQSGILGQSQTMLDLLDVARRVAAGSASILIQGETGTGKTMIAREIHECSPRASQRFVAINCSAFQDQLLESELFGHEKGSFTGALSAKQGLFETAHQGTLFLDEIGNMTSAMQAKLLQVLDDGELRRVGGTKSRRVDTRVLAATNKDLQEEVQAGRFRADLLFRINVINLTVPRLCDRREDIPILADHFLERFCGPGAVPKHFSDDAMRLMMSYDWPGNVRELANTVEGLTLLAPGREIRAEDLPPALRPATGLPLTNNDTPLPLSEIERLHILNAIRYTEGKKAPAARLLGIDVKTLRNKINSYDIDI